MIPEKLSFLKDFIGTCTAYQKKYFPDYEGRFVYLTVRSGEVCTTRDDEFHVDGFQGVSIPRHIPEQNYLWADKDPTLFALQPYFVRGLDPGKHNIHTFLDQYTDKQNLYAAKEKGLYVIDPYHVHARQVLASGTKRTVVRLTFSPVEIRDDRSMVNKWLPRGPYNRDDVRNQLVAYDGPEIEENSGLTRPAPRKYPGLSPFAIVPK